MSVGVYERKEGMKTGKYIRTPEIRKKYSEAKLGKKHSAEHNAKKGSKEEKNPNWKGGRYQESDGYIMLKRPDHIMANCRGYIKEHRIVMEKHIGRTLMAEEVVHHINGKRSDNRIENLQLFPDEISHQKHHDMKGRKRHEK